MIISVLQQTVNGVPAIVLDLLYLAAVDYIKAKEKAKQSKKTTKSSNSMSSFELTRTPFEFKYEINTIFELEY